MSFLGYGEGSRNSSARAPLALVVALVLAALALPSVAAAEGSQGTHGASSQPSASPVETPSETGGSTGETSESAPVGDAGASTDSAGGGDAGSEPGDEQSGGRNTLVVDLPPPAGDNTAESPAVATGGESLAVDTPASEAPGSEAIPAGEASSTDGSAPAAPAGDAETVQATGDATAGDAGEPAPAPTAEPAPAPTAQQTATIGQAATATAVAEQTGGLGGNGSVNGNGNGSGNGNGNGVGNGNAVGSANGNGGGNGNGNAFGRGNGAGNTNADVRVGEPGTGEGIAQANRATADAEATATADVDTAGEATVSQTADASATAAQTEIGNVQVSVRVESPGDDGDIAQANEAAATSSADTSSADTSSADTSSADTSLETAGETADAVQATADSTAVQDGVSNTVVSVRVLSPGDDGTVSQVNDAVAAASADDATATAVQDDVSNTYVGIRVESPGDRGAILQTNVADADTTTGGQIAVVSKGIDTVVVVDINAADLSVPDETTVWEWTWDWSGDEAALGSSDPFVISGNSWEWDWRDPAQGTVIERQVTGDETTGTWTWDWSWGRELPGWAWEWRQQATLACATCIWIWRWDWQWTGQPAPGSPPAAPVDAPAPIVREQETEATAVAVAGVEAVVSQVVEQDNEATGRFAGQIADAAQVADASALARQRLAGGLSDGVSDGGRTLVVTARASATASVEQWIEQVAGPVGDDALDQWAGQQAEILQAAVAEAVGAQSLETSSAGRGIVVADATVVAETEQIGLQAGLLGGGILEQWLGQQVIVAQLAGASARTTQSLADLTGATALATAAAIDVSLVAQAGVQDAARSGGIGSQRIGQYAQVVQDAVALARTGQSPDSLTLATSDAAAVNRSLTLQAAVQTMDGASFLDVQESSQQVAVTQVALASSSSTGGIGGAARTVNCATTQQGAGQGLGSSVGVDAVDLTAFCTPPTLAAAAESPPEGVTAASSTAIAVDAGPAAVTLEDEILVGHGTVRFRAARASAAAATPGTGAFASRTPFERARVVEADGRAAALSQVSRPVPSQAGFDSRPKGSAGADAVTGESSLPWTGGPPAWATALASAVAAFGGSGIAAILAILALTPPLLRRVRDGAVVRRPISVSIPIDVPV